MTFDRCRKVATHPQELSAAVPRTWSDVIQFWELKAEDVEPSAVDLLKQYSDKGITKSTIRQSTLGHYYSYCISWVFMLIYKQVQRRPPLPPRLIQNQEQTQLRVLLQVSQVKAPPLCLDRAQPGVPLQVLKESQVKRTHWVLRGLVSVVRKFPLRCSVHIMTSAKVTDECMETYYLAGKTTPAWEYKPTNLNRIYHVFEIR